MPIASAGRCPRAAERPLTYNETARRREAGRRDSQGSPSRTRSAAEAPKPAVQPTRSERRRPSTPPKPLLAAPATAPHATAAGAARRLGGTGRRPDRSRRGHGGRPAAERQGISGISRDAADRRAGPELQGAGRQVRGPRRGRADRRPSQEGRTVPALDSSLALLSGVLLALSFPKFGHPACAWMALTPLIIAAA